jgi:hypothetical protein
MAGTANMPTTHTADSTILTAWEGTRFQNRFASVGFNYFAIIGKNYCGGITHFSSRQRFIPMKGEMMTANRMS